MASGSWDKTIRIWNVTSGLTIKTLTGDTHSVTSLVVLQDGSLASGSYDATTRIWNKNKNKKIRAFSLRIPKLNILFQKNSLKHVLPTLMKYFLQYRQSYR